MAIKPDLFAGACAGAAVGAAVAYVAYKLWLDGGFVSPSAETPSPRPSTKAPLVPPAEVLEATAACITCEVGDEHLSEEAKWDKTLALAKVKAKIEKKHPGGFDVDLCYLDKVRVDAVYMLIVPHLSAYRTGAGKPNVMGEGKGAQDYNKLIGEKDHVIADVVRKPGAHSVTTAFLRAGPRATLHFDPKKVRAAIVTCGGLCPGLNNIIQGVTRTLIELYGVDKVYGVRGGYEGFTDPNKPLTELTLELVDGIQFKGGTVLGSGRGGFDADRILEFLEHHGINQLYVCGGDGTHRAANKLAETAKERKVDIAVCGVPKTIDNDIDLIDRSFGFQTAVEEAQKAIRSAQVEAKCNLPNGIGIVKLMGRHAGFIAVHSTLCSGEVDLCLVPEVPVVTEGHKGCLPHLERVIEKKGHAVIVVAEGAGEEILGQSATFDAGGNRKLPELGLWLKDEIGKHFKRQGKPATVKYIDPSYMIRSVAANANDAIYCELLAQNAVHGAMAGYTAFSVGMSNNRVVYIPITALVKNSPRKMDCMGRTWERVLSVTGQPNTVVRPISGTVNARTVH